MADVTAPPAAGPPEPRPPKRQRTSAAPVDRGPELEADSLLEFRLNLPSAHLSPGAIQANRLAIRVLDSSTVKAYVANEQHVYEVSLDLGPVPSASEMHKGKEGVLVPVVREVGHMRQLEHMDMEAEVQGLAAEQHGGRQLLAAVDSVGNVVLCLLGQGQGPEQGAAQGRGEDAVSEGNGGGAGEEAGTMVMRLDAPNRGECGWTGLAVRAAEGPPPQDRQPQPQQAGQQGPGDQAGAEAEAGSGLEAELEVAVARQRCKDVLVYVGGRRTHWLRTLQGPTALTFLPHGPCGGSPDPSRGLLAVAEEHQISLWDVRPCPGSGCCVQRIPVAGQGWPLHALRWCPAQGGMLAATGAERSVVMLETKKWHVAAKWQGCVKYPATHMAISAACPRFAFVAGLDYECAAGHWDGSSGGSAGNANSGSGGHGRAVGPAQLQQQLGDGGVTVAVPTGGATVAAAAAAADEEAAPRAGLSFRGNSKWLGLSAAAVPLPGGGWQDVVAALSLSGHVFLLRASAAVSAVAQPPTAGAGPAFS